MFCRELEQQADDFVLQEAEAFGAVSAVTVLQQQFFGPLAAIGERRLEPYRDCRAHLALAAGVAAGDLG